MAKRNLSVAPNACFDKTPENAFRMVVENYSRKEEVAQMAGEANRGLHPEESAFIGRHFSEKGARVLDIGCGAGREAVALGRMGFRVTGIDVSGKMLAEARRNAGKAGAEAEFKICNGIDLPFESASFDYAVVLDRALEHIQGRANRVRALREIRRVLKPSGILVFNAMNSSLLGEYLYLFYSAFVPFCEPERWKTELKETSRGKVRYYFGRYARGIAWESLMVPLACLKNLKRRVMMAVLGERYNGLEPGDAFYARRNSPGWRGTLFMHRHALKETLGEIAESGLSLKEYMGWFELSGNPFGRKFLRNLEIMHYYAAQKARNDAGGKAAE